LLFAWCNGYLRSDNTIYSEDPLGLATGGAASVGDSSTAPLEGIRCIVFLQFRIA